MARYSIPFAFEAVTTLSSLRRRDTWPKTSAGMVSEALEGRGLVVLTTRNNSIASISRRGGDYGWRLKADS